MANLKTYDRILHHTHPVELALFLKTLYGIKRREVSLSTMKFYADPITDFGFKIMNDGQYEPEMSALISRLLKSGDVFVDAGGNEGYFSVFASKIVGESGKVFCVEPQARLWPVIEKNFLLNKCTNIHLLRMAAGETEEEKLVYASPSLNSGQTSLVQDFSFLGSSKISTAVRKFFSKAQPFTIRRLDSILRGKGIEQVDVIKVDVEGFEFSVIKSCESLLKEKRISNLLVEIHPGHLRAQGLSAENIISYLSQLGYSHQQATSQISWFNA